MIVPTCGLEFPGVSVVKRNLNNAQRLVKLRRQSLRRPTHLEFAGQNTRYEGAAQTYGSKYLHPLEVLGECCSAHTHTREESVDTKKRTNRKE